MWPTNLTADERPAWLETINHESTVTKVEAAVRDLDHKLIAPLDYDFTDGQVNHNKPSTQDADAFLQAGFVDDAGDLLDLDLRHLIEVKHHLFVPTLDKWAVTPMFCGQVVATSSDETTTTIEAHSKDAMALVAGGPRMTLREGRRFTSEVRRCFEELGETRFRIANGINRELREDIAVGGPDVDRALMRQARKAGDDFDLQVFYDTEGYLVIRRRPTTPLVTWTQDPDSPVLSPIKWNRDMRQVRNTVVGKGKDKLEYTATLPDNHAWSPRSLRRGGKLGKRKEYINVPQANRRDELKRACERRLDQVSVDVIQAQLEVPPTYHATSQERCRSVRLNGTFVEHWLGESTIPLGEGSQTVGYQDRRRSVSAGRIRVS